MRIIQTDGHGWTDGQTDVDSTHGGAVCCIYYYLYHPSRHTKGRPTHSCNPKARGRDKTRWARDGTLKISGILVGWRNISLHLQVCVTHTGNKNYWVLGWKLYIKRKCTAFFLFQINSGSDLLRPIPTHTLFAALRPSRSSQCTILRPSVIDPAAPTVSQC